MGAKNFVGSSFGAAGSAAEEPKAAGEIDLDTLKAVDLETVSAEPDAIHCISDEIARTYNVLPLRIRNNKLYVAMADPKNIRANDDIRFITKKTVVPLGAPPRQIAEMIEKYYTHQRSNKALEDLKNEFTNASKSASTNASKSASKSASTNASANASTNTYARTSANASKNASTNASMDFEKAAIDARKIIENDVSEAPAVRLVNSILNESAALLASDIHLEPFEDGVRVRYRVDGSLMESMSIPSELYSSVSTRIKIIAGMDIAERRLPQDGRIEMDIGGKSFDFRISSLPTVFGEKIEIRKLDRSGFAFDRDMLMLSGRENKIIDSAINAPRGIVLVTGPTGSGKTTTIYSLLSELNRVEKNIVTIEDPVEYMVRGINQVQVNTKAGLTFASGLRSILRQDPDIIMIGEIRDEETAEIAVRAAITGHLVLSTLHTIDAPGSITRLMDMGIQPYLLSEAVTCVIAQRLVRRLCEHCKSERAATASDLAILKHDGEARIYDPVGCDYCGRIGYRGRRAIHEVLHVDSGVKNAIEQMQSAEKVREAAVGAGMATLYENCCSLVLDGTTSIQELVNTVYAGD